MNDNTNNNSKQIKFGIVVATFFRKNNKSNYYVKRCLDCINKQTYKNWHLYLMGDDYENLDEYYSFKDLVDKDKITLINNLNVERNYLTIKEKLWCCGGATSVNIGLNIVRNSDCTHYVHLDDDDYWSIYHLELAANTFNKYENCIFYYSDSTYGSRYYPNINCNIVENNVIPYGGRLIHSSIIFDPFIIPFNYTTIRSDYEHVDPADLILLNKIHNFIIQNTKYHSIYMPILTVYHDEEGNMK